MQKIVDGADSTNVLFQWKWEELEPRQKAQLIAHAVIFGMDFAESKEEANAALDEAARHIWPVYEGLEEKTELLFVSSFEDKRDIDFLFNDGDFQPVREAKSYTDRPARKKAMRRFPRRLATEGKAAYCRAKADKPEGRP